MNKRFKSTWGLKHVLFAIDYLKFSHYIVKENIESSVLAG